MNVIIDGTTYVFPRATPNPKTLSAVAAARKGPTPDTLSASLRRQAARRRTSKFSGAKLYAAVDHNPRRRNSHGHKSMEIILRHAKGVRYDAFIRKGGRLKDLYYDLEKGNVKVWPCT